MHFAAATHPISLLSPCMRAPAARQWRCCRTTHDPPRNLNNLWLGGNISPWINVNLPQVLRGQIKLEQLTFNTLSGCVLLFSVRALWHRHREKLALWERERKRAAGGSEMRFAWYIWQLCKMSSPQIESAYTLLCVYVVYGWKQEKDCALAYYTLYICVFDARTMICWCPPAYI